MRLATRFLGECCTSGASVGPKLEAAGNDQFRLPVPEPEPGCGSRQRSGRQPVERRAGGGTDPRHPHPERRGSLTYRPDANFNGSDSFAYRADDGSLTSDAAAVTLTVTAGNDPHCDDGRQRDLQAYQDPAVMPAASARM